jgi:hypothetical protein
MSEAWKQLDLEGGGLQGANLRLAALLRKRGTAFALLALFPLGLHRDYLHDRRGAWLYRSATLLSGGAWLAGHPLPGLVVMAIAAACAACEAFRMEDAVARINKQLRIRVYLGQTAGTPPGFKGHYTDSNDSVPGNGLPARERQNDADTAQSAAGQDDNPRAQSFAQQEKMLREMAEIRRKSGK